ncbi:hypothetical protein F5Y08DRAFT_272742 [Xylaria arbuscula]|nr:hypothetical protein F5Y08DRAFT_272742 [Xylaria arbuscula]
MKLSAALYFLAFSPCALTAPTSTVADKVPSRQQEPRINSPIKIPINTPSTASKRKGSKAHGTQSSGSQHQLSSSSTAKPTPKKSAHKSKKPKTSSYLASLAQRLTNKSPFSEEGFVREETMASTGDWESEGTIVESETKASRVATATIWIPCFTADKTIHYHRIRVNTDMLVVSLVLSFIAVVLVIELWKPVAARIRRIRSGHGPIHLSVEEGLGKETPAREPCLSRDSKPMGEECSENKQDSEKTEMVTPR